MHICPAEIGAIMIVIENVIPYMNAIWYTKVIPTYKKWIINF